MKKILASTLAIILIGLIYVMYMKMETVNNDSKDIPASLERFEGTTNFNVVWDQNSSDVIKNSISYNLTLDKKLEGTLKVDGYQSFKRYAVTARPISSSSIDVIFTGFLDEDDFEPSSYEPTIEDVLFGLSIVDNKIIFNKKSDWVEIHDGQIMNHGN